jgi:hypothetical protein
MSEYSKYNGNQNRDNIKSKKYLEDDALVIEDNTIYEVDLDCYECLMKEKKKHLK